MQAKSAEMETPHELNETDREILRLLDNGRETRGSLADNLDKHTNYIGDRLKWLRNDDLVEYYHEGTSLQQITEKGREWITETET